MTRLGDSSFHGSISWRANRCRRESASLWLHSGRAVRPVPLARGDVVGCCRSRWGAWRGCHQPTANRAPPRSRLRMACWLDQPDKDPDKAVGFRGGRSGVLGGLPVRRLRAGFERWSRALLTVQVRRRSILQNLASRTKWGRHLSSRGMCQTATQPAVLGPCASSCLELPSALNASRHVSVTTGRDLGREIRPVEWSFPLNPTWRTTRTGSAPCDGGELPIVRTPRHLARMRARGLCAEARSARDGAWILRRQSSGTTSTSTSTAGSRFSHSTDGGQNHRCFLGPKPFRHVLVNMTVRVG